MDKKHINDVIDYIEKNLSIELSPEIISKNLFISLSQLYRDFYSYTGHSIKEYIRKRRISNACEKIKYSDMPLDVISTESGCKTQQSFHKQFKSIVGLTPIEYKNSNNYFYFYPFNINKISLAVNVGNEYIPECKTTRFYDSCLIGIEDKAISELGEMKGRVFGRNANQIDSRFCYEVMTEISGLDKSGTYATCIVNYNEKDINDGWNYLYNIWLLTSMFEQSDDEYFEEYIFKNGKPYKLKLYLPVRKCKTSHHITISQVSEMYFVVAREIGNNAEHKASEKLMNFFNKNYPLLVENAKHFYVCNYNSTCKCGIECGSTLRLSLNSDFEIIHIPTGKYAILQGDCIGDVQVGVEKINLWLKNNSIAHEEKSVFAIYEILNDKYDIENISMKLYKAIKNDKNG